MEMEMVEKVLDLTSMVPIAGDSRRRKSRRVQEKHWLRPQ